MKKGLLVGLACVLLVQPSLALADSTPPLPERTKAALSRPEGPIMAAVRKDAGRLRKAEPSVRGAAQDKQRSWIRRHPVLFGAMVGAGAGLIAGGTMENELICQAGNDEDCLFYNGSRFAVGAGAGAAIGALVGWIAGKF